jgi:PAS domain S-box-containing protein
MASADQKTIDLQRNLQLFKQVLESSGLAMSIRDDRLRPIYVNKAYTEAYGYTVEDLHSVSVETVLPPESLTLYDEEIIPALKAGSSWEGEYPITTKSGKQILAWGRFDPIMDDRGKMVSAVVITRDASTSIQLRNALAQAERHLKFLASNTRDCLFRLRLTDGGYDYISPAITSITGYSQQEFYETPRLFERIAPDNWRETFDAWWKDLLRGEGRGEYESPLIRKDGATIWVNQRINLVRDDDGTPVAIEGIITDVTERKLALDKLDVAEKSLSFISESTSEIFFRLRLTDGRYDYLSPSVERFSGYSLKEYEENPLLIREIVHPDWRDTFDETLEGMQRGHVPPYFEFPFIHRSGEVRWAGQRNVLHKDDTGTPIALEGLATDITDFKRTEEALRESETKYRFLAENLPDVVWTLNNELQFTYATPSVADLWGYTPDEFVRIKFEDLFTPESLAKINQACTLRSQAEGRFDHINRLELEHICKDGTTIWAETLVRRLYDKDNRPLGCQGISRDMTERLEAEQTIQESEQRFRNLFKNSPISLWEEDLSGLKAYFDALRDQGVTDFAAYFEAHPEAVARCATLVRVLDVNQATLDLLRAPDKESLLTNIAHILPEEAMPLFAREMAHLASGGFSYSQEMPHRTLDGEIIWVVSHFAVPPEHKHDLSRIVVSLLDVTQRKQAEQALRENETRYRSLFHDSPISLWEEDLTRLKAYFDELRDQGVEDFREYFTAHPEVVGHCGTLVDVVSVNRATLDMLKADSMEQLLGSLDKVLTESSMAAFTEEMILLASGVTEYTGEITHRTLDGDTIWVVVNFTVPQDYWGNLERVIVSLIDVTDRKRAEQALQEAHDQMEDRVRLRTFELSEANQQLTREVAERIKAQEHVLSLTRQQFHTQEHERQRISRDLHDKVAQDLSTLVLRMETLFDDQENIDHALRERGEEVTRILRQSIAEVRHIAYGLRPPALDQLGLVKALKNDCEEMRHRSGLDIDFFASGMDSVSLDSDTQINIYRMVQEGLNNMASHSKAEKGSVRVVASHPDIIIRIEDNGQGFAVEERMTQALEEKHLGLRSMEERARLIGGSMEIQSLLGKGTRIIFKIPIDKPGETARHGTDHR